MMTERNTEKHHYLRQIETGLDWANRLICIVYLPIIGHWWSDLTLSLFSGTEILLPVLLPAIYCLGLILSWKFRIVGGGASCLAVLAFYLTFIFDDGPSSNWYHFLFVLLALPSLVSIVAGTLRYRRGISVPMSFHSLRPALAIFGLFCMAVVGWKELFGHSFVGGARGTRFLGRETHIQSDRNSDGQFDFERRYSWSDPFRWDEAEGWTSGIPISERRDDDFDGDWDTWVVRGGNDIFGVPLLRYDVDLTLDGEPDWSFSLTICDKSAREKIEEKRGF